MIAKFKLITLMLAFLLYAIRTARYPVVPPILLLPIESCLGVFSIIAFGYIYLNKPSKALSYLSKAAYPVYILHMIFIALSSVIIVPLALMAPVKYILVLTGTIFGSYLGYEYLICRYKVLSFLFGVNY